MLVVTANDDDNDLTDLLCGGCGGAMSVLRAETVSATFSGAGPDIVFVPKKRLSRIACENAVFIIRRPSCIPAEITCKNAVAVVDSSNLAALEQVAQRHLRALTCGLCSSDTFTFSSLTADSAVISLRRPITAFDGSLVDPFELPAVFPDGTEPFALLAAAAVFCLTGQRNPFSGRAAWVLPS